MKKPTLLPVAIAGLLFGVTAASAATMSKSINASDSLNLTGPQQKTAWHDLYMGSLNQKGPSGFSAVVGAVVPNSVTTAPVTSKAARAIPSLKPYDFAMVQKKLVIVNPSDRKIAEVITHTTLPWFKRIL
jgi:Protein of unknown function (DUF1236)